jgi:polyphosphate kinase 2 (PPK2 family)
MDDLSLRPRPGESHEDVLRRVTKAARRERERLQAEVRQEIAVEKADELLAILKLRDGAGVPATDMHPGAHLNPAECRALLALIERDE